MDPSDIKKVPYICYFCGFKGTFTEIHMHIRSEHGIENPTPFGKKMYGKSEGHPCQDCKVIFKTENSLKLHICGSGILPPSLRESGEEGDEKCPVCQEEFSSYQGLTAHYSVKHMAQYLWKFPCEICDNVSPNNAILKKHKEENYQKGV